jgi:hypothetical protein
VSGQSRGTGCKMGTHDSWMWTRTWKCSVHSIQSSLQVRPCGIDKMRTRLVIRKELVGIVNDIQKKCWTAGRSGLLRPNKCRWQNGGHGDLATRRRKTSTTDQDLLVGSALAMMMSSNIQRGSGSCFKWCPVKSQLGSSRCGVVSISAARSKQGRIWRAVTIGRRVKGIPTLCVYRVPLPR